MKNLANKVEQTVVVLPNDFSGFAVDELKDQFEQLVEQGTHFVILDFTKTEFIDSSGIGAIVFLYKRIEKQSNKLSLLNVTGQPFKLMNLLRVDKTIPFIDSI
ncbi:STAS domain-containing protein [Pseudoalteromonas sp. SR44-5]|uniref:STAS domain-containing protein n=1 Tax=Pseudoalteromonas rhizosphaerae TaxID=2518973 RepID=A0ABW8KWD7_9GAMM|nr:MULTISPECIES: STAS domain-containing protein [Pseudoalteromonas]MBB1303019.1 STAS domain-containing protein [Pseudoalteromonas sp. SR44-8]MBB1333276.1 STAS domain-containing protein [Pseudoalteromonas sp. SR41-6]MBB1341358.1 STAS domain-containing protein [Pseudoalteromonas sp. SR45-6]MBB1366561.1 STAS domain-containing protein [Pseudoalteromonas sp. SR44-5]MBB1422431.1 STAS domain-containing protein [Pseudoalteromonas sp. SG43-7]